MFDEEDGGGPAPGPGGQDEAEGAMRTDAHGEVAAALDRIEADLDDVAATLARMG